MLSPSSSSPPDPNNPIFSTPTTTTTAVSVVVQPPASKPSTRRLPPPCWSDAETVALIECYREKWYSLRRGNLRAPDWQEVADGVAGRCPLNIPAKTPIQCRHKMEKLRKRYRSEIQRIGSNRKAYGSPSSWIHFKLMDSMELGVNSSDLVGSQNDDVADEDEDDLMLYKPNGNGNGEGNGVRIKIPNFAAMTSPPMYRNNNNNSNIRLLDDLPPSMNPGYGSGGYGSGGMRNGYLKEECSGGVKRKSDGGNVMEEMVGAIHKLADGFMKTERMKMDMARELESMRMKAEMRQTEMILETHRKMWESFSETFLEKKKMKVKRMGNWEQQKSEEEV